MYGLKDKIMLVTGAGGAIGRAICKRAAKEKAKLMVLDLNWEAAKETCSELEQLGCVARPLQVDITDHDAVGKVVHKIVEEFGRIDVLVNNAGWDKASPFLETDPELWQKIIAINYVGPLNLHHHVLPVMKQQKSGSVINISSDAGRVGSSGEAVYAGCKAGVIGFGKSAARELSRDSIRINCVCPGPTNTPLFDDFAGDGEYGDKLRAGLSRAIPMGRIGEPEDVAGIVCFLASEESKYVTGQTISVSGGLTMQG